MKEMFVMSVMGPNKTGTIRSIAELTRQLGGEWARSKIMRLEGQLAGLMKVIIDKEQVEELKAELGSRFPDLVFTYSTIDKPSSGETKQLNLVVDCQDRPGLTKELSRVLASLDLIVENMECNRVHVSSIGQTAFTARVQVAVPESMTGEGVADEIEALAGDVRVTVA